MEVSPQLQARLDQIAKLPQSARAAIIFGIHSPLRCLAGGLAIGVIEALSAGYTSGMVTSMLPSLFMLIVLLSGQLGSGRYSGDRP